MRSMLDLFRKRELPVAFLEDATHRLDRSLFRGGVESELASNGLQLSPANIILAAAVHYHGRNGPKKSFKNLLDAWCEVAPSILRGGFSLGLSGHETNEFQAKSSEVIAVGIGLCAAKELFGVSYSDISPIVGSGKRCDFEFTKNYLAYTLETKGRKYSGQIKHAVSDVYKKKENYTGAKYGFVSHLPRDGSSCSLKVVDPEFEPREVSNLNRVITRLNHYAKAASLSGFWRLSELLVERAKLIDKIGTLEEFNEKPLDFGNVEKLGIGFRLRASSWDSAFFISKADNKALRVEKDTLTLTFGLQENLMEVLERQDYDKLLSVDFKESTEEHFLGPIPLPGAATCHNDGTVLVAIPTSAIHDR